MFVVGLAQIPRNQMQALTALGCGSSSHQVGLGWRANAPPSKLYPRALIDRETLVDVV